MKRTLVSFFLLAIASALPRPSEQGASLAKVEYRGAAVVGAADRRDGATEFDPDVFLKRDGATEFDPDLYLKRS
ncbi:hypothetical protein GGS26DRAFT_424512 [Hypomontagnella submonticulosa]|nr:hypothetical protein GGS26DRAFT_424512 [Hypomontagnella submonticulosa]